MMTDSEIQNRLEELGFIIKSGIKHNRYVNCAHISWPAKKNAVWYKISDKYVSYASWNGCLESGYFWLNEKEFSTIDKAERDRLNKERQEQQRKIAAEDRQRRLAEVSKTYNLTNRNFYTRNKNNVRDEYIHPYLRRKQVLYRNDMTFDRVGRLVIPMLDINKILCGYHYIDESGTKKFKIGSILKASFYPFLPETQKLDEQDMFFLAEGVATAASIYDALSDIYDSLNYCVLACFASNNVDVIADQIRAKYGNKTIITVRDNDPAGYKLRTTGFTLGYEYGQDANDIYCELGRDTLVRILKYRLENL